MTGGRRDGSAGAWGSRPRAGQRREAARRRKRPIRSAAPAHRHVPLHCAAHTEPGALRKCTRRAGAEARPLEPGGLNPLACWPSACARCHGLTVEVLAVVPAGESMSRARAGTCRQSGGGRSERGGAREGAKRRALRTDRRPLTRGRSAAPWRLPSRPGRQRPRPQGSKSLTSWQRRSRVRLRRRRRPHWRGAAEFNKAPRPGDACTRHPGTARNHAWRPRRARCGARRRQRWKDLRPGVRAAPRAGGPRRRLRPDAVRRPCRGDKSAIAPPKTPTARSPRPPPPPLPRAAQLRVQVLLW